MTYFSQSVQPYILIIHTFTLIIFHSPYSISRDMKMQYCLRNGTAPTQPHSTHTQPHSTHTQRGRHTHTEKETLYVWCNIRFKSAHYWRDGKQLFVNSIGTVGQKKFKWPQQVCGCTTLLKMTCRHYKNHPNGRAQSKKS